MGLITKYFLNESEVKVTLQKFFEATENISPEGAEEYARQLLNNPLYMKIHNSMSDALTEIWKDTKSEEVEKREDIHRVIQLLDALKGHFEACLTYSISKASQKKFLDTIV